MVADLSAYVSADSNGDYTVNTDAIAAGASSSAIAALSQMQATGGNWGDVNTVLTEVVGATTAAVTLLAGAAAAGPLAPAAALLFGAAEGLVLLDPAHGGTGSCRDCNGKVHQAPQSGWAAWAGKTCCPECLGFNPHWYTIAGSGAKCGANEDVGNGPRPNWAADSFEAFADALLVADMEQNWTFSDFLQGKTYNFARWPAILALAIKSWNSTHGSAGKPTLGLFAMPEPNTGGTRMLSVGATTMTFAGEVQPGTYPTEGDTVSSALWFSQFSAADWKSGKTSEGKIPPGSAIQARVNNGPKNLPAARPIINIPSLSKGKSPMAFVVTFKPVTAIAQAVAPPSTHPTSQLVATTPPAPSFLNKTLFTLPNAAKTPVTVGELGVGGVVAGLITWGVKRFL